MSLYNNTKVIQCHAVTGELDIFVSWFKTSYLTYSKMTSFHLVSQFCNPHGNGHMLPLKLTARLGIVVVVASSERETGRRRREEGEGHGRWDLKNQGSRDVTPIKLLANQVIT